MSPIEQIQQIEEKVQQLAKKHQSAQKEVLRLQKENARLAEELAAKTQHAEQLQQKVDAVKLTASGLQGDSKKELEKRIDSYLKDIDKCLALLHS